MKKVTMLMVAIAVMFCGVTFAQNIIENASFEDLTPSFWEGVNGTFGSELGVGSDADGTAKTGFRSFKITKSAATSDIVGWKSVDNANLYWNNAGSGTFSISASVKTVGVNTNPASDDAKIGVKFEFMNASGTELASATLWADQSAADVDWADLSDVVILSEAPEQVYATLLMGKDATGTVYFDGIGCNTSDSWTMGIFNGGAEDVAGWMDWYGGNGNYAKITDAEAHSGTYSAILYQDSDTSTSQSELVYYSKPYAVEAGEWYKVGVWVKTEDVNTNDIGEFIYPTGSYVDGAINLCFFTHGGDIETGWSAQGDRFIYIDQRDSTTGWTHYVGVHQAKDGEDPATGISVRARFNNWVTGTAYFDDFSVEKIVVEGGNLISNPGVEDLTPSFWEPVNGTFGSELGVGSDADGTAKTGFRSFKVSKSAATSGIVGWKSVDNANLYWNNAGSGTFAINASVKTVGVNTNPASDDAKIGVKFEFMNAAGTELASATLWADQSAADVDWADLSDVVILSEAPEQVYATLLMGKDATGTVYFDGIGCNTSDSWTMGIFNGGAEDVAGWMDWYGGNGNYTKITDAEAHTGTNSVIMYQDSDTSTSQSELVYYSKPYTVEAGEWYKVGVWVKTEDVNTNDIGEFIYPTGSYVDGAINLCFFTHGGDIETGWSAQGDRFIYIDQRDSTTGWTHYAGVHQAKEGEDPATGMSVRARFNNWVTGTAYFDDFSVEKMVVVSTAIEPENGGDIQVAKKFNLKQNYPNPFNPTTTIAYNLPEKSQISLTIYNILGQQVRTLTNTVQNAGAYSVVWDAKNEMGEHVPSGMYLYVLTSNNQRVAKKMVLMR